MPCYLYKHVDIIQNLFLGSELDLLTPLGAGIAGSLADFCQVSIGEPPDYFGHVVQVHILGHWALPQVRPQNCHPGPIIRQGNVNELV